MEPIQNSQPQPSTQPAEPQAMQQAQDSPSPSSKKNHTLMYIGIFMVLILVGIMLYIIVSKNQTQTQAILQENKTPASSVNNAKSLDEKEAESIDVGDPEPSELKEVEENINKL